MSFFLGNMKRDLSDKSKNVEDANQVKENVESTCSLSDEVFSDGVNSPECAKILVNGLRNVENQVKELFVLKKKPKTRKFKWQSHLNSFQISLINLREKTKRKTKK